MIGKRSNLNFKVLFSLISTTIVSAFFYTKNYSNLVFYIVSIFSSVICTKKGIKLIKKLNFLQTIQEEVLSKHKNKKNTPTMGGLFIIPIFLIIVLIIGIEPYSLKSILFLSIAGYFFVGFLDDFLSIRNKTNLGLKTKDKLILQSLIAILFIVFIESYSNTSLKISFLNNIFFYEKISLAIIFLIIVGLSNAVNLTDGLDGLVPGCSAIAFCGLGSEILLRGDDNLIGFSVLCYSMSGLCLGFLKFNKYPAKIFLGDTGSICIGGTLAFIGIITNSFWTTLLLSSVFIIEMFSVIMQVGYFKLTKKFHKKGKRIFLMSPLHHHFEMIGIEEQKIVANFWKINITLMFLVIVLKIII